MNMGKLATKCTHCERRFRFESTLIGKNVRCPGCGGVFQVSNIVPDDSSSEESLELPLATRTPASSKENVAFDISTPADELNSARRVDQLATTDPDVGDATVDRVGRYRIVRELGRGAFGVVYIAHDDLLKRDVALKLCSPMRVEDGEQRLLSEARAAARLRHPNIVAVFEAGTHEGQVFIASELVAGKTLAERIDDGDLEPHEAAIIVRDLARGLEYAHSQNLVHRDIKPHNVLIDAEGRPQITDFGLAFDRSDEAAFREQAYSQSGTLAYMAPEQAGIGGVSVGPAADQYALGVTLFEMLSGERPHQGNALDILTRLESPSPPRVRSRKSNVDFDLDAITSRSMAHSPWNRYDDCGALADDIDRYLAGDLIRGRRVGPIERIRHFSKKRPQVAAWMVAAAATVFAVLAYTTTTAVYNIAAANELADRNQKLRGENNSFLANQAALEKDLASQIGGDLSGRMGSVAPVRTLAATQNPRELAGWVAYSRKLQKASKSLLNKDYDQASELTQETLPPYRGWEYFYLANNLTRPIARWKLTSNAPEEQRQRVDQLIKMPEPTIIGVQSGNQVSFRDLETGEERHATRIPFRNSKGQSTKLFPLQHYPVFAFVDGNILRFWDHAKSVDNDAIRLNAPTEILAITDDDRWLLAVKNPQSQGRQNVAPVPVPVLEAPVLVPPQGALPQPVLDPSARIVEPSFIGGDATGILAQAPVPVEVPLPDAPEKAPLPVVAVQSSRKPISQRLLQLWDLKTLQLVLEVPPDALVDPSQASPARGMLNLQYSAMTIPGDRGFLVSAAGGLFRISEEESPPSPFPDSDAGIEKPNAKKHVRLARLPLNDVREILAINSGRDRIAYLDTASTIRQASFNQNVFQESQVILENQYRDNFIVASLEDDQFHILTHEYGAIRLSAPDHTIRLAEGGFYSTSKPVVSSNGRFIVAAGEDQIVIWDTRTSESSEITPQYGIISSIAQSKNGELVAAATLDGVVEARDMGTGTKKWEHRPSGSQMAKAVAFSPTQPIIAIAYENAVQLLDTRDGSLLREIQNDSLSISSIAFSGDGTSFAVGRTSYSDQYESKPPTVAIHSTVTGESVTVLATLTSNITALAFAPDRFFLAICTADGKVLLWDGKQPRPTAQYVVERGGSAVDVCFSPMGDQLAFVVSRETSHKRYITEEGTYEVARMIPKTHERTREYQKQVWKPRTQERNIFMEGLLRTATRTKMVSYPETYTTTEQYIAYVPVFETKTRVFYKPVFYSETGDPPLSRAYVVSASPRDLTETARWYPEGHVQPHSLAYQDKGQRLYVSTDHGISVLHPHYFFELVELHVPAEDHTATSFGPLLFNGTYNKLLAVGPTSRDGQGSITSPLTSFSLIDLSKSGDVRIALQEASRGIHTKDHPPGPPIPDSEPSVLMTTHGIPIDPKPDPEAAIPEGELPPITSLTEIAANEPEVCLGRIRPTIVHPEPTHIKVPFHAAGEEFTEGTYLPAEPGSRYLFDIPEGWSTVNTLFALTDTHDQGVSTFVILGDGKTIYRSSIIRDQRLHGIQLDIRGIKRLEFLIEPVNEKVPAGSAAWLEPTLYRETLRGNYALEYDEVRIHGKTVDWCEMQISPQGFELREVRYTEPTFDLNGYLWTPAKQSKLPNQDATQFFSPGADFSRARVHFTGVEQWANAAVDYEEDSLTVRLHYPPNGNKDFRCVVQVPIRDADDVKQNTSSIPEWTSSWRVGGFIPPGTDGSLPAEIDVQTITPYAMIDLETIDWTWPKERTPVPKTPENQYAIIGQRQLKTEGGYYRIESIYDDAVRIRLDGEIVLDDWNLGFVRQSVRMIRLSPGTHTIRFEHFKRLGKSRLAVTVRRMEDYPFAD